MLRLIRSTAGGKVAIVVVLLASLFFWLASKWSSPETAPLITQVAEVLRPAASAWLDRQPVRLIAVATYSDPDNQFLYAQDETGALLVNTAPHRFKIEAGERVQIEGIKSARASAHANSGLIEISVRGLGRGNWPLAQVVDAASLSKPEWDSRLVEIRGTVRSAMVYGRLHLVVMANGQRIEVAVRHHRPSDLEGLLDARVVVQGVCVQSSSSASQAIAPRLFVAEFKSIRVERPGPMDPFALAAVPFNQVRAESTNSIGTPRVRIQGLVAKQSLRHSLVLQAGDRQILVWSMLPIPLAKDDRVEAIGFPVRNGAAIELEDAQYRLVQSSPAATVTAAQADAALPTLTTIKQILALTREESRQHYPVKVRGVVTQYDAIWKQLFIQDGDDALYVNIGNRLFPLKSGELIEVSGVTVPGEVLTMISPAKIESLGNGVMPAPVALNYQQAISGVCDSRRVKVAGTVQSVEVYDEHLLLDLVAADGRYQCTIPQAAVTTLRSNLLNAVVEVESVCVVNINSLGVPISVSLPADREASIRILETAPADEFNIPLQRISDVLHFIPPGAASRRMKVEGAVTLCRPGREIYVQDGTGGIRAQTSQASPVELGDEVELVGFRSLDELTPMFRNAEFRVKRKGLEPIPRRLEASAVLSVTNHGDLIQIQARLLENSPASPAPELVLEDGQTMFTVGMEPAESGGLYPAWSAGSLLRVTGVCHVRADETRQPRSFRLLARSPADIVVLRRSSWITVPRVLALAFLLVGAVIAALAWVAALQGQVRHQTQLIRQRLEHEASLEERCRELVEHANDAIFTYDLEGRLQSINEAGERVLGYRREEALRMSLPEIVAPEHHARLRELMRDGEATPLADTYELAVHAKDGRRLVLELSTRALASSGHVTGFETIARDITGRKRAEERLRNSEARLAEAQRIGHVGSWEFFIAGRRLSLSAEACRMLELEETSPRAVATALGRLHAVDRRSFWTAMKSTLRGERAFSMDHRLRLPSGVERAVHSRVEAAFDAAGDCVRLYGTIEDVSERRALEVQLRQAQKMESIGQLAAGVAHDFNNLLTVIQGNTSLMLTDERLPADCVDSLSQIAASSQRAADLTRQLLAFSRKQFIQPRVVDLNDVVASTAKMLGRVLGEHIELKIAYGSPMSTVRADPSMISQVIMNLSVNARDAMPKGGRLELSTAAIQLSAAEAHKLADGRPGFFVRLRIQDTGSGMSPATVEHLFEPFFTTKDIGKGTGLGLSTVYGIVKQHEGMIEVASQPGKGTVFEVYLPAHGALKDPATHGLDAASPSCLRGAVLIVEDEAALRTLAVRVLQQQGCEALAAASGKEALEIWALNMSKIELLLTDMVMPDGISGGELAKRLRAQKPSLKVVYTSGYSPELLHPGVAIKEGVNFLSKPYVPAKLIQTLRNCLET
jgi:PAS domain S-box-containing protein